MTETGWKHATLDEALVAAQAEFGAVEKDTANPFFKSTYADLPAIKREAQPVLAKHGLAVTQKPSYIIVGDKVHDTLITEVVHVSGVRDRSEMILKPVKNDPQAQGSAITYAKRYAFQAVLGIVSDVDDDGNAASGNTRKPAPSRARASAPADDGVDQAALNQANADLKTAAKAAGSTPAEVVAYFQETYNDNLVSTRSIANLQKATEHYQGIANAKSGLGATEVGG